jgi:hypothetical protein
MQYITSNIPVLFQSLTALSFVVSHCLVRNLQSILFPWQILDDAGSESINEEALEWCK